VTFSLILVVGVALRDLLEPSQYAQIPAYAGTVLSITLLGWGIGGAIGGVLADYPGRQSHDDAGLSLPTPSRPAFRRSPTTGYHSRCWPAGGHRPRFDAEGDAVEHVRY